MENKKNNSGIIIGGLVVLAIVLAGAFFFLNSNTQKTQDSDTTSPQAERQANSPEENGQTGNSGQNQQAVKEFTVSAENYDFSVKEMKVKKGETVKVTFVNREGLHDWVLDEFNAKTKIMPAGGSETVEFVADKSGTFEYYCSVGNHRQLGMVGKLIVE